MNIENTKTNRPAKTGSTYTTSNAYALLRELTTKGYALFKWSTTSDTLLNFFTSLGLTNVSTTKGVVSENRIQEDTLHNWNSNTNDFYFHQDGSHLATKPKFVVLHCIHPGTYPIPTLLTDARSIYADLQKQFDPALLQSLQAVYINSKFQTFKRPFVETSEGTTYINTFHYLEPNPTALTQAMRISLNTTLPALLRRIEELQQKYIVYTHQWHKNDVLLFNNQIFHHARFNPNGIADAQRHLRRMWFM